MALLEGEEYIQGHRKGRTFINWLGNIKNWVLDQI